MVDTKNFEVPEQMREFAEASVNQAKKAFDEFIEATHSAVVSAEESASAVQSNANETNKKALSYAEENVTAAFDFANKMVKAKNVQELVSLQQKFVQSQMETLGEQARDLNESVSKLGGDS